MSTFDSYSAPQIVADPRRGKQKKRKLVFNYGTRVAIMAFFVGLTLFASGWLIFQISRPWILGSRENRQALALRTQLSDLSTEDLTLQKQSDYLKRPDGIENALRTQGYLKPGEHSLVIEPAAPAPPTSGTY